MQRPFPFKIGADPEFTVLVGERKADAQSVMKALLKGNYKVAKGQMGYDIKGKADIGWDGCASTGEIRPNASNNPQDIIDNIAAAFQAITDKVGIFDYTTLSKKAPIGGHIHLDIDGNLSDRKTNQIHRCLSAFYIPLLLGEDVADLQFRNGSHGGSYGQMSDYKIQPVGEKYTYEFRVPSAEWLTTPKIAKATMAYLATVYNEIIKDPGTFNKKYENIIWKTMEQGNAMQKLLLSEYLSPLEKLVKSVKAAIKTFEFYPDYKDEIEYLFHPKKVLEDKQKAHFNIIEGWNLSVASPTKRDIMSAKNTSKKGTKLDFDAFASSISIPYNADTNVEIFATELKKRVINLGWKLKNQYFLFGLRKGVEDFTVFNKSSEKLYDGGQIKTQGDATTIAEVIHRMSSRFQTDADTNTKEERKTQDARHIMVGIPYSMRLANKSKKFIELIYNIEKGKYAAAPIRLNELDASIITGKILSIYNPMNGEDNSQIRVEDATDSLFREYESRILIPAHEIRGFIPAGTEIPDARSDEASTND